MELETVQIEVLGREFGLNVPVDEKDRLKQALHLLKQKIEVVQAQGNNSMDNDLIIIIGALNLIHDFLKIKNSEGLDLSEFRSKITDMEVKVRDQLNKS